MAIKSMRLALIAYVLFLSWLHNDIRHVPHTDWIHIKILTLRVVKEELLPKSIEKVDVAWVDISDAIWVFSYFIELLFKIWLLLKGQLLQAIDYFLCVGEEATLTKAQARCNLPQTLQVEVVACHRLYSKDLLDCKEELRVKRCRYSFDIGLAESTILFITELSLEFRDGFGEGLLR